MLFRSYDGVFAKNAGNDLKISGSGTISGNVFWSYCTWFTDARYPAAGDSCRAGGGLLGAFNGPNQTEKWTFNTMLGNPSGMFVGDSTNAQSSDTYYIENNIFVGIANQDGARPFFSWFSDSTFPEKVVYVNNLVWGTRNARCYSTGIICKDPLLKNQNLRAFDATPSRESPALGAAVGATREGGQKGALRRNVGAIQQPTWKMPSW